MKSEFNLAYESYPETTERKFELIFNTNKFEGKYTHFPSHTSLNGDINTSFNTDLVGSSIETNIKQQDSVDHSDKNNFLSSDEWDATITSTVHSNTSWSSNITSVSRIGAASSRIYNISSGITNSSSPVRINDTSSVTASLVTSSGLSYCSEGQCKMLPNISRQVIIIYKAIFFINYNRFLTHCLFFKVLPS